MPDPVLRLAEVPVSRGHAFPVGDLVVGALMGAPYTLGAGITKAGPTGMATGDDFGRGRRRTRP